MGEACERLFEGGLALKTDGGVTLLAGSTFGGGGAINWGASLRTPHYVRREWAEDHNLPFFLAPDFNRHLDNVCNRMGVQTPTTHNHRNIAFLSGAQKLGYNASVVPQNASPEHQDPYCSAGCGCPPGARKMGTLHTYLPDAARAGARFITGLHCKSLIFSKDNNKRVVGVSGIFGSEEIPVVIKAREVIVAAGGLNSPALLLNSGLTSPLIGANLHLHPSPPLFAAFPEKRDPAVGSCLTTIIESFDNLDGKGHGVRLETIYMDPGFVLPNITSASGAEYKEDVLKYQRLDGYCVLIRDEQSGRVTVDGAGKPVFHYTVGAKERQWALTGLEALAKIALVEGAEKIWAPVVGFPPWVKKGPCEMGALDPGFQQWLAQLKAVGLPTVGTIFGSAHQQGSCKMGATPATGVVDPKGRVWGYEGLSLADASILPSASGVNPMITVMAVAEMVAEGLKERLKNAEGA
jgi:choline dehydrogenase-like flavoprotein